METPPRLSPRTAKLRPKRARGGMRPDANGFEIDAVPNGPVDHEARKVGTEAIVRFLAKALAAKVLRDAGDEAAAQRVWE